MADWTLLFPALTGFGLAIQGAASGVLATHLGRGLAGVYTIGSSSLLGLLFFLLHLTFTTPSPSLSAGLATAPWWSYLGGLCAAFFVVCMTVLIRRLGAGPFFVVAVLFQLATGAAMDHGGWFGLDRVAVGPARGAGLAVAAVGVVLVTIEIGPRRWREAPGAEKRLEAVVVVGEGKEAAKMPPPSPTVSMGSEESAVVDHPAPSDTPRRRMDPAIVFPAIAGILSSFQSGMNGALGKTGYGPAFATLISLVVCLVGMVAFMVVDTLLTREKATFKSWRAVPVFAWTSGLLGCVYVLCVTFLTPRLGAAALIGVNVACNVAGAAVLDHFGWMGMEKRRCTVARGVGLVMVVAGVGVMTGMK
ncbi:hypothetical protein HDU96_009214 [Phlyctochytrium bullatum]|nr:hypothetical protein HDU96_009214 [Phlyctochytrium bullatum]